MFFFQSSWLTEMSQGLTTSKPEKNSDEDTDEEYKTINPPVRNLKKTAQQRRKQKEQKKLKLIQKLIKQEKKKVNDVNQLKKINKLINKTEVKTNILKEKREKKKILQKEAPKRLSLMKFEETELEFNMGPDISGNLRNIKIEGNLLLDRFKSFQKRNIIQPTVKRNKKKPKVKVYTKPGHKEDWIKTVAR